MSDNVIPFDRGHFITGGGGSGPEDPMLEQRVGRLEEKLDRIEAILTGLAPKITEIFHSGAKQTDLNRVERDLAEVKGRISNMPTSFSLWMALISIFVAGAGIVFAALKFTKP